VTFLAARWLVLLLAVAALAGGYVWVQVRGRARAAVRFTNLALLETVAPQRPGWRRHVAAGLLLASLIAMVIALARPAHDVRVARRRATIVMAIDVSISMQATDVTPSRLAAAKAAATEFARSMPSTVRLGLVAFAGRPSVLVAPTTDHDAVVRAVDQLQLQEATAIGDAVLTSLDLVEAASVGETGARAPGRIVLMSDGETTVGTATVDAAGVAARAKTPVMTIAFGTEAGVVEVQGQLQPVPVNRAELAELARVSGGKAYTAETAGELKDAYRTIGSAVGYAKEKREWTTMFVGLAFLLAMAAAAASLRWTSRLP
jgi:Ca-activated chloride channel family protein